MAENEPEKYSSSYLSRFSLGKLLTRMTIFSAIVGGFIVLQLFNIPFSIQHVLLNLALVVEGLLFILIGVVSFINLRVQPLLYPSALLEVIGANALWVGIALLISGILQFWIPGSSLILGNILLIGICGGGITATMLYLYSKLLAKRKR